MFSWRKDRVSIGEQASQQNVMGQKSENTENLGNFKPFLSFLSS